MQSWVLSSIVHELYTDRTKSADAVIYELGFSLPLHLSHSNHANGSASTGPLKIQGGAIDSATNVKSPRKKK